MPTTGMIVQHTIEQFGYVKNGRAGFPMDGIPFLFWPHINWCELEIGTSARAYARRASSGVEQETDWNKVMQHIVHCSSFRVVRCLLAWLAKGDRVALSLQRIPSRSLQYIKHTRGNQSAWVLCTSRVLAPVRGRARWVCATT